MTMVNDQPTAGGTFPDESAFGRLWKPLAAWALSFVTVLGMLLAFHAVTRGAVLQAQMRQQAVAAHAEAKWRCKDLRSIHASGECLLQLNTTAQPKAQVHALNLESGPRID